MTDSNNTPVPKITCVKCGKENVPDWNGKSMCITCARNEVLGTPVPDEYTLEEIVKFLCGESDLGGRWFGDYNSDQPIYWWRKHLRQAAKHQADRIAAADNNGHWVGFKNGKWAVTSNLKTWVEKHAKVTNVHNIDGIRDGQNVRVNDLLERLAALQAQQQGGENTQSVNDLSSRSSNGRRIKNGWNADGTMQ